MPLVDPLLKSAIFAAVLLVSFAESEAQVQDPRAATPPTRHRTWKTGDGMVVRAIAFSPDGKHLLTAHGGGDSWLWSWGHVKVWDVAEEKQIHEIDAPRAPVTAVKFSPVGDSFVVAGAYLTLWDGKTFEQQSTVGRAPNQTLDLAFSPDGKYLASCHIGRKSVSVWDVAQGKLLCELAGHEEVPASVSFSADGKTLATSVCDKKVIFWNTAEWKQRESLALNDYDMLSIEFAPSGNTLCIGGGFQIPPGVMWDITHGKLVLELEQASRLTSDSEPTEITRFMTTDLAFSPDGRYLAFSDGRSNELRDAMTGKQLAFEWGWQMRNVVFSPDGGLLATASMDPDTHDAKIYVFDLREFLESARLSDHVQ